MAKTTQEELEQYGDAIGTAYDEDGSPQNEFLLRLIADAHHLAQIERQVIVREEWMPEAAVAWERDYFGCHFQLRVLANERKWSSAGVIEAPDLRPDEPGPLWLPIIDPPDRGDST